jgi:hypothetical protein
MDDYDPRASAAIRIAAKRALPSGTVRPVHLLAGIAESSDAVPTVRDAADALRVAFPPGDAARPDRGVSFNYLTRQVMGSAQQWAQTDRASVSTEHLLVALAVQADRPVVAACIDARLDLAGAQRDAMARLGWPTQRVLSLWPLEPAGTIDRPPMPVDELPAPVWAAALERLARLPFARIHRGWEWSALSSSEHRYAWRLADEYDLDDDERYSLLHHYSAAVDERASREIPELVPSVVDEPPGAVAVGLHGVPPSTFLPGGWVCWFANRRAGTRDRWFRLTWRY